MKQIKQSDMVLFYFLFTLPKKAIRRARQGGARAVDLPARSFDLARPGVAPPMCREIKREPVYDLVEDPINPVELGNTIS